jgi:hypothetical protein
VLEGSIQKSAQFDVFKVAGVGRVATFFTGAVVILFSPDASSRPPALGNDRPKRE